MKSGGAISSICGFFLCLRKQTKDNESSLGAQALPGPGLRWYSQEPEENDLGSTLPSVLKKTLLSTDVCSLEPMNY